MIVFSMLYLMPFSWESLKEYTTKCHFNELLKQETLTKPPDANQQ